MSSTKIILSIIYFPYEIKRNEPLFILSNWHREFV